MVNICDMTVVIRREETRAAPLFLHTRIIKYVVFEWTLNVDERLEQNINIISFGKQ